MISAGNSSAINPGYRQKRVGIEAGTADQRTIDVNDRQQFLGVRGFYRTTVKDARSRPHIAVTRHQPPADEAVGLTDIFSCRRKPGADRPNRLVSRDQVIRALLQRNVEVLLY